MNIDRRIYIKKLMIALILAIWFITGAASLASGQSNRRGRAPQMWLLAVGISRYRIRNFRLDYADQDAVAFQQTMASINNLPDENARLLLNNEATKANILQGFNWLKLNANPQDIVVFYFSGHGFPSFDPNGFRIFPKGIIPYDALLESAKNDISYPELVGLIHSLEAYEIAVIIDACGSGDVINSTVVKEEAYYYNAYHDYFTPNVTYLVSCEPEQISKELNSLQHGIFTYYLLDGLKDGKADEDDGGRISARELFDYAFQKIHENRFKQKPMFLTDRPLETIYLTNFSDNMRRPINLRGDPRVNNVWDKIYARLNDGNAKGQEDYGQISVDTYPPGCNVLLDNISIGKTPLTYACPPGRYQLTVARTGYEMRKQQVEIKTNRTLILRFTMEEE